MRTIKFRAWQTRDRNKGFMNYKVDLGYLGDSMVGADSSDVLMQYTGLKDKNGREIYEGDIIKITRKDMNRLAKVSSIGVVEWLLMGKFSIIFNQVDFPLPRQVLGSYVEKGCKVIGNIYENPDLLKI